ncbi:GNAT family N-acetyltransferase [Muricauda sp. SCSIO 64092]|uniref:GNAT family N-acetyltransferase n=1 Tax=Allomuricauda sp. SCSIO 64092 TaxID=2908842 RepID=UPI001FF44D12|nr:GNAT family N-acetyltransferase [Muricauda sp. SCSIO 64092]UOY07322.1 GNAT family N-acetyltransferase [Muricauda sp. SCSIO 64092]
MNIELLHKESKLLERGIEYFWKQWGNESNFDFYKNCIENSIADDKSLPKFYLMLDEDKIIGSYALLTNDLISRQDLFPWFACLFVDESYRNQGLANALIQHGIDESRKGGFDHLYLSTALNDFYEKKGWKYHSQGFTAFGDSIKIYSKKLN